jgi:tetratricopeptide (TPR) repeat protein
MIIQLNPSDIQAYEARIAALEAMGRYEDAYSCYLNFLKTNPNRPLLERVCLYIYYSRVSIALSRVPLWVRYSMLLLIITVYVFKLMRTYNIIA